LVFAVSLTHSVELVSALDGGMLDWYSVKSEISEYVVTKLFSVWSPSKRVDNISYVVMS
jgi:hypothetical protein